MKPYCFIIGRFLGLLHLKFNPSKVDSPDGPFQLSFPLFVHGLVMYLFFLLACVRVYTCYQQTFPHLVFFVYLSGTVVTFYYLTFYLKRQAIVIISNRIFKLQRQISRTNVRSPRSTKICLISSIFVFKVFVDYEWILKTPVFHLIVITNIVTFFTLNGIIYGWFLFGKECVFKIEKELDRNKKTLTTLKVKQLALWYLNTEQVFRLISKDIGVPYLMLGIETALAFVFRVTKMNFLNMIRNFHGLNKQALLDILHFIEWNVPLCVMCFVCWQSHKLNLQAQKLKESLENICCNRGIRDGPLHSLNLFKNGIMRREIFFSAFEDVSFNFELSLKVINLIVTYICSLAALPQ